MMILMVSSHSWFLILIFFDIQGKKGPDGPQGPDGNVGPPGPDGNKVSCDMLAYSSNILTFSQQKQLMSA